MTAPLIKRLSVNIALIFTAIFVTLVLLEVGLRVFLPQYLFEDRIWTQARSGPIFLKPRYQGVLQEYEFRIPFQLNNEGFRDYDFSSVKNQGVTRIVVLGDSFVFGWGVSQENTFAKTLERKLNSSGAKKFEVLNFGIYGLGGISEFQVLKQAAIRYRPDLVVVMVQSSDLQDNLGEYARLLAPSCEQDGRMSGAIMSTAQNIKTLNVLNGLHDFLSRNSHLYVFLRTRLDEALLRWKLRPAPYLDPLRKDWPPPVEKGWRLEQCALLAMKKEAQDIGADFIIAIAPSKWEALPAEWIKIKSLLRLNEGEWEPQRLTRILFDFADNQQIPMINPAEALVQASRDRLLYYPVDGHWTSEGHEVVAEALYEALRLKVSPRK